MNFTYVHTNLNVRDLEASIRFYGEALGLQVERRKPSSDGSFELAFLADGRSGCQIELTWLKDHPQAYDLGENEHHICFQTDDYDAPTANMRPWAASAMKTRPWTCISSPIRMATGLRSFQSAEPGRNQWQTNFFPAPNYCWGLMPWSALAAAKWLFLALAGWVPMWRKPWLVPESGLLS